MELATAPKAFAVGYYLGRVEGYSPPVARALVSGARRLGIAERIWTPDLRDRMGFSPAPPPASDLGAESPWPPGSLHVGLEPAKIPGAGAAPAR
jgi:hypothetical protein